MLVDMCYPWTQIYLSPNSTRVWAQVAFHHRLRIYNTENWADAHNCQLLVCANCTSYYPSLCATSWTSVITKCSFRETVLQ